jgi:hypothetical protein
METKGGAMRRHRVHELRRGSFADGQAAEPPDTAIVGRFSIGQEHPDDDDARPAPVNHLFRRFAAGVGRR